MLVVEGDRRLCEALVRVAAAWAHHVRGSVSYEEGARELRAWRPELLLVNLELPGGSGIDLVELAAQQYPIPTTIAMSGEGHPEDAFRVAQAGARAYVAKPMGVEDLEGAVRTALTVEPRFAEAIRGRVGRSPMRDVLSEVRCLMKDEALSRAGGNRAEAARILEVSRQAIHQMVTENERSQGR